MYLPRSVSFAVSDLQHLLVPLYLISAVALVELSYRVAEAATAPAWRLSTAAIRAVLVIVIAVKLSQRLLGRSGEWVTYVKEQRSAAVQAVLALLLFLVAAWVFRALRGRRREAEGTTEGLVYAGSFLVALPLLVTSVTLGVGSFLLHLGGGPGAAQWVLRNYPQGRVLKYGYLVIWLFVFAAGLVLYLRNDALSRRRELGAALILLGAWGIPNTLAQRFFDHPIGFRPAFADLLLTVAVAGYVAVRWQRVDGPLATRLVALLVFTWLVAGRGDPLERLGSLLTLPEVVVIVFGVVFTLLSDSSFASATSTNFPRDSRPLLWIGFLIFSASVSNFIAATHGRDITRLSETVGFHYLAIPLAAWLVIRRRFARAATERAGYGAPAHS